jgi:undecaprenyl-diphosphatase
MTTLAPRTGPDRMRWPDEVRALVDATDIAACDAIIGTATPRLDRVLVDVSNAANYSRLWLVTAAATAIVGGGQGRRAACQGVLAIALTSTVTNLILKPLARRKRPTSSAGRPVPDSRRVRRPASASFPSGHAASAFAFASGMGHAAPGARLPLRVAAATVAYSRVHTGVHYPSDVAIGAVLGDLCGWAVGQLAGRLARRRR